MKDQQARSAETVVAEVDGRAVTLGDVKDAIAELPPSVKILPFSSLFPEVLRKLVVQQALVIRAQRQSLDDDPAVRRAARAAADIIREVQAGADFATLAKRSSEDATPPAGGDAGFAVRDAMTPELGAVVFSMQLGSPRRFRCAARLVGSIRGCPAAGAEAVRRAIAKSSRNPGW